LLSLLRDEEVIAEAREEAQNLVEKSPDLAEFPGLASMVASLVTDTKAEYLEKA
jgi:ATP-dependent DNA helicase RecG